MKEMLILLFSLFFILINVNSQCAGEIILTNQAEVDAFPQNYGCSSIEGNLSIGLQTDWNNISSLDSLYQIENISGGLGVYTNVVLKDLSGLENLSSIGTYLGIRHCDSLSNLIGLSNLTNIGGETNIAMNDVLVDLSGLENLEESGGIILQYNPLLESLSGLENLISLEGLSLRSNETLPNLSGLSTSISTLKYFSIVENDMLTNLSNLEDLENVDFYFEIDGNDSLINLSAFSNVNTVGANMRIINNQSLTDISGLENLMNIGGDFTLSDNSNLSVCCVVLDFADEIEGEIMISNNDTTCNSTEGITNFCSDLLTVPTLWNQNRLGITISPNPNKGRFYLKSNFETILSVKIQNSLGEIVFWQKLANDILLIDLGSQSSGFYFMNIKTPEGILVEKILIQ